jgi:hypothetical protein
MAGGTNTNFGFFYGGLGFPYLAAGTDNLGIAIFRMDIFFHFVKPCF